MIIAGIIVFILTVFMLLKKSSSSWLNQFVFLTLVTLFIHISTLILELSTILLVVINTAALSFLILMFFTMVFFKEDVFPKISNTISIIISCVLWSGILVYYIAQNGVHIFLDKANSEYESLNVFFSELQVVFLKNHLLSNFYIAALLFVVMIFCIDIIFNQER